MSDPPKRFAPPPPHWPGRRPQPAAQPRPAQPLATQAPVVRSPAIQPQATFGALRGGKAERSTAGDELLRVQGDEFLLKTAGRGLHVKPNGTYNFVRVQGVTRNDAHTFVSPRSGHAGLAAGKPVLYAGTVRFDSGRIDWWSNYSGTYQPVAAFRRQAQLPDDHFVPWQKLQMGGVGMQRGMFNDRHASTAPATAPAKPDGGEARKAAAPATPAASAREGAAPAGAARPAVKAADKPAGKEP